MNYTFLRTPGRTDDVVTNDSVALVRVTGSFLEMRALCSAAGLENPKEKSGHFHTTQKVVAPLPLSRPLLISPIGPLGGRFYYFTPNGALASFRLGNWCFKMGELPERIFQSCLCRRTCLISLIRLFSQCTGTSCPNRCSG